MFKELKYLYITLIVVFVLVLIAGIYYFAFVKKGRSLRTIVPKKPVASILFIGDSNTAADFSYADQLRVLRPSLRIKKIALNGAKTDWMYSQVQNELATNTYDVVSILGGSNDIYATDSISAAKPNLDAMYNLIKSKGSRVLAITPPNKNFYTQRTDHKQEILKELNQFIKSNPRKDYYIDFWTITNNPNFFTAADEYLHAQKPAHTILANKVIESLNL